MNSHVRLPENSTVHKMSGNLGFSKNTIRNPLKEKDTAKCPIILDPYWGEGF